MNKFLEQKFAEKNFFSFFSFHQPEMLINSSFSKSNTNVVKGVAVCLLLIHHLYGGVLPAPIKLLGDSPALIFATLSKVCVAVFTLLSGYGLAISYQKSDEHFIKFTARRIAVLMKRFWLIYLIFFVGTVFLARPQYAIYAVYGDGVKGAVRALIDFLALWPVFKTGTINQTWWYMEAALVLYLLFPIIFRLTKKAPWLSLPLASVPLILYFFMGNNVWNTCREIYWIFPFATGIFLAQRDLLSLFCKALEEKRIIATLISAAVLLIAAFCRAKIGLAFDTFFAISIVLFSRAVFCSIPFLREALAYLGIHSSDIFMTHSFFYCYFISQKLFSKLLWSLNPLIQFSAFPLLLLLSLLCSILINGVRKGLKMIP